MKLGSSFSIAALYGSRVGAEGSCQGVLCETSMNDLSEVTTIT
jgi:hypothetical protein